MDNYGISGKIAEKMIDSPLVPIILIVSLLLGAYGMIMTPREDRPEVQVPMAIITVSFPGAGPEIVDALVARPVSSWAMQHKQVETVRSVASGDAALVTVTFETGVSDAAAFSELNDLIAANKDALPPGAGTPEVRTIGDEQLSTLMITLFSARLSAYEISRLSDEIAVQLEEVTGVRSVEMYGRQPRQVQIMPSPQALAAHGVSLLQLVDAIKGSNLRLPGDKLLGNKTIDVHAGAVFTSVDDLRQVPVGSGPSGVIYLEDVAKIIDGPAPVKSHVLFRDNRSNIEMPAVSLSITSVPGKNIRDINNDVRKKFETLRGTLIPSDVHFHIGYDAGRIATEQVGSVLKNLLLGTIIVVFIILAGLGWRAALTVFLIIPATLAFVPFAYYFMGFTLNPVSLAAMILAIGIVPDDNVIMIENTSRYFRKFGRRSRKLTIMAIDEVGNPTILVVFLIIATILPTAFLTGEMGQFIRVVPIGSVVAIFASICLAVTITPYLAFRLLPAGSAKPDTAVSDRLAGIYRMMLYPFMNHPALRWLLYLAMAVLLAGAFLLIYTRSVQIGLAPYLDREVFVMDIRLPSGSPLEKTIHAASEIGRELRKEPEVTGYTIFAGTGGPDLYPTPEPLGIRPVSTNQASIYVHLSHGDERKRRSYEINQGLYDTIKPVIDPFGAEMIIRRIPSGPAKKEDIHAEIYGPSPQKRFELAARVEKLLCDHPAAAATLQTPEASDPRISIDVDRADAAAHGIFPAEVAMAVHTALSGSTIGTMHIPNQRQPVPLVLRLSPGEREYIDQLKGLHLKGAGGKMVSLADLVTIDSSGYSLDIHRKNLLPVVYVAAKIDRKINEPFVLQQDITDTLQRTIDASPDIKWLNPPNNTNGTTLHWGGEWGMTRQVYRDLGIAAIVAIILTYSILTAWFGSYTIPLLIMLPVPLVFIGVIPAHWLWGLNITGLGIMGVIALTGIVVRNAVLLVDFIRQRIDDGMPLRDAIISAGALRTRPIILTASTVMFGSGVLIFEPALEPLGLTLASGVLVSTILTLVLIPVLYYHYYCDDGKTNSTT